MRWIPIELLIIAVILLSFGVGYDKEISTDKEFRDRIEIKTIEAEGWQHAAQVQQNLLAQELAEYCGDVEPEIYLDNEETEF